MRADYNVGDLIYSGPATIETFTLNDGTKDEYVFVQTDHVRSPKCQELYSRLGIHLPKDSTKAFRQGEVTLVECSELPYDHPARLSKYGRELLWQKRQNAITELNQWLKHRHITQEEYDLLLAKVPNAPYEGTE